MSGYKVARLEEIDEFDDGRCPARTVRAHFGISSFGINAWTAKKQGDRLINEHDEADDGQEELYLVHQGRARWTTLIALGGKPGEAYEVSGWEFWAPFQPLYAAGKYEEAADQARPVAEAHPEYSVITYNLACCEALAGRKADAIVHLGLAFERRKGLRAFAAEDSDLDSLRDEPAFKELVG